MTKDTIVDLQLLVHGADDLGMGILALLTGEKIQPPHHKDLLPMIAILVGIRSRLNAILPEDEKVELPE